MLKKVVGICLLCLCVLSVHSISSAAVNRSSVHRLNYFHYNVVKDDEGTQIMRIEIGVERDDIKYHVSQNPLKPKQLLIDLENTEIGNLRKDITLDGKITRYMTLRELERRHTQVMVSVAAHELFEDDYKVYLLPADRHTGKPVRLVIDIKPSSGEKKPAADKVEGVKGHTIVIDPGHGGSDTGAIGPSGLQEKNVTLAVAKKVEAILNASGAHVIMTRNNDRDVYGINSTATQELQARVNVGLYAPETEVFLSIHADAFTSPSAHGTGTYYYPRSQLDADLAWDLQQAMVAGGGLTDRGIREARFYVLKHSQVPASLVELAFISNYHEQALLGSEDFQQKMAKAICEGLGNYFNRH